MYKLDRKCFAGIFSIQKNTRFSKLKKMASKYDCLLEKEGSNYIIDDIDGGEWVCKTLNEVEDILTNELCMCPQPD